MRRLLPFLLVMLPMGAVAQTPTPPACAAPEFRQFDFWVGRWDVVETKTGAPAGTSLIESLYQGCAIRENYGQPGFNGGSLNHYGPGDKLWRQTWTDSAGAWREFVGGLRDGKMVLVWVHPSTKSPASPSTNG